MIVHVRAEDLSFIFQPAKSSGMYNSIAIAGEIVSIRMRYFGVAPSATFRQRKAQICQRRRQDYLPAGNVVRRGVAAGVTAVLGVRGGLGRLGGPAGLGLGGRLTRLYFAS